MSVQQLLDICYHTYQSENYREIKKLDFPRINPMAKDLPIDTPEKDYDLLTYEQLLALHDEIKRLKAPERTILDLRYQKGTPRAMILFMMRLNNRQYNYRMKTAKESLSKNLANNRVLREFVLN